MNMDIEQLAREAYQHDTQLPPEAVWESIERQLDAPSPKPVRRRRTHAWVASAALLVGAAAALLLRPAPAEESTPPPLAAAVPAPPAAELPEASAQPSAPVAETQAPLAEPCEAPTQPAHSQMAALPAAIAPKVSPISQNSPIPQNTPTPQLPQPPLPPQNSPTPQPQAPTTQPPLPSQPQNKIPQDTLNQPIPNFLSPNGDGENDCFVIPGWENYTRITLEIYNSRSQRVYKTSHYDNTFCGDALPDGNYFYVIRFYLPDHTSHLRRGTLLILR